MGLIDDEILCPLTEMPQIMMPQINCIKDTQVNGTNIWNMNDFLLNFISLTND